jgi:cyclophilin family peptidyl-prolyl cis-trans isomerase
VAKLLQSLAEPFEAHREAYVRQWQRTAINAKYDFSGHTSDGGHVYRLSRCILLAHEDKSFQGALVASMSIPWGETRGDDDLGGYHLVWTRDMCQSATGLLAAGSLEVPLHALIYLAWTQKEDGGFDQNFSEKPTRAPIKNEAANGLKNERGTLAMARTQVVDSATAQFFINLKDNVLLDHGVRDFGYAVFGKVTKGMDVVDAIANVPTGAKGPFPSDCPREAVIIESIRVK